MNDEWTLNADPFTRASLPSETPSLAPPRGGLWSGARIGVRGWTGKRTADITLSVALLLLTFPLLLLAAILIKLTSAGPVLFRQRRVGCDDRDFLLLKFRSMHTDSERRLRSDPDLFDLFLRSSHKLPCRLDPRVTGLGRVLRRLSLDELPQLLNVLCGHMSMVGPRPVERSQFVRDYSGYEHTYLSLRPGLTGLWQVSGRSTVQFPERAKLDGHYLLECGPWLDTKILLRTPLVILTGLGAD